MRRGFGYAGVWVAVTSVAVTVSWFGCAVVLHGPSPASLPALAAGRPELAAPPQQAAVDPTMIAAQPEQSRAAGPAAPRTTNPHTSRSTRPDVPSALPTDVVRGTPPPHSPQPVPPGGPPPDPSPTAGGDPTAVEQTYQVTGGATTLRFSAASVQVTSLKPSPGYRAYLDRSQSGELVVIFTRPGQESDLHAAWIDGPTADVTEYWW